jgi:type I restriction enzyme S subunit
MSNVILPNEWQYIKISDVSIKAIQRKPEDDEEIFYVDIGSIDRVKKIISNPQIILGKNAPSRARKSINTGDVLVSLTRPNLNAVALVPLKYDNQIASTGFEVIKSILVDSRYIFNLTRSKHFIDEISGTVQGALYPAAKSSDVQAYEFSLPSLAEQKEICNYSDSLLTKVDSIKASLDNAQSLINSFRKSVFASAVSGELSKEWRKTAKINESAKTLKQRWSTERQTNFEEAQLELIACGKQKRPNKFKYPLEPDLDTDGVEEIPLSWELVSVSQFAECLDNLRVPVKKEMREASKGLYPYFGANGEVDRVDEYIFDDDIVLVTEDETFYGRTKPIAFRFTGKCWVNNHAHVLKAPTKTANDYLSFVLMYYKIIPWLSGTTGRAKLTQASLNVLPLGLPPEEEQIFIVNYVDKLLSFSDAIEEKINSAQDRVKNLTQSILAKAFRGELTAKWREINKALITGDNSAKALLEKIKVEREALSKKKSPKKKVTKKTTAGKT